MSRITESIESLEDANSKAKAKELYALEEVASEQLLKLSSENDMARRKWRPFVIASCSGLFLIPALSEKQVSGTLITIFATLLVLIPIVIALRTMVVPKNFREEFRLSREVHRMRKSIFNIVDRNGKNPYENTNHELFR